MSYKTIITGSRRLLDFEQLTAILDEILKGKEDVELLLAGAGSADTLGEAYANRRGFAITKYLPEWSKHGRNVALRRNQITGMQVDECVCFRDGMNKGTINMIHVSGKNGLIANLVLYS